MRHLKTIRKIVGALFLLGFLALAILGATPVTETAWAKVFLEFDPLIGLSTSLATAVLYAGLWMSLITIVLTMILGRFFCSWVCPLGVAQDVSAVSPKHKGARALKEQNRYRDYFHLKYGILLSMLVLSALGAVQVGLLDPLALCLRTVNANIFPALQHTGAPISGVERLTAGGVFIGLVFVTILVITRFIPRFWCRALCPLGALLGVASRWSLFQIRRNPEKCTDCGLCRKVCNGAADPDTRLRPSECVLCFNCIAACPEDALTYGLPAPAPQQAPDSPDLTRRRALASAAAGLVAYPLFRGSISGANRPHPELIRPPGSLPEDQFLGKCVKCGACNEVCPTGGLQPAILEGGIEALWTPVLKMRVGYCEHRCTLCGHSCPTGAIRKLEKKHRVGTKEIPPVKIGTAFFDRGRCLPWAMGKPCMVCEEVCPTSPKAIWVEQVTVPGRGGKKVTLKQPYVDPELCTGCGICETHCPVEGRAAIRVTSVGETRNPGNRMLLGPVAGRRRRRRPRPRGK